MNRPNKQSIIVGAVLVSSCGAAVGLAHTDEQASPSPGLQSLVQSVDVARSRIEQLDATFTFNATNPSPNDVAFSTTRLRLANDDIVIDRTYGALNGNEFDLAAGAADGVWWRYRWGGVIFTEQMDRAQERMREELNTIQTGLSDFMGWYPCHESLYGTLHFRDLRAILQRPNAVLRDGLHDLNGAKCHVVELVSPNDGAVSESFWIDPSRGYLPVRHVSSSVSMQIDEAVEAAPGVWIPVRGTRVLAPGVAEESPQGVQMFFTVDDLNVNHGEMTAQDFDFLNGIPAGTRILDLDTATTWLVSAEDFEEGADVAIARAGVTNLSEAQLSSASVAVYRNPWWYAVLILSAGVGAFIALRSRR